MEMGRRIAILRSGGASQCATPRTHVDGDRMGMEVQPKSAISRSGAVYLILRLSRARCVIAAYCYRPGVPWSVVLYRPARHVCLNLRAEDVEYWTLRPGLAYAGSDRHV